MKRFFTTLIGGGLMCCAAFGAGYQAFDSMLPGNNPMPFAPKKFTDKTYAGYQTFDPSGEEFYYAVTDRGWTSSSLYKMSVSHRFAPVRLDLLHSKWEGEPFITRDGAKLYFTAIVPPGRQPWHADLYVAEKAGGGWGKPKILPPPVNSSASEWHLSVTDKGIFYFCSERDGGRLRGDIFRALPENGSYRIEKLPLAINSAANDCDPLIAPDESWLIFHSNRPGGFGEHDLYISFRNRAGQWSQAVNMGPAINTAGWEMAPSLTPDGKYLMFVRRKAFVTDEPSRIFWVSEKIIDNARPR